MPTIEFDDATVVVPGRPALTILGPLRCSLTEQRIALIGANGSGKSTMARLLNGLVTATSGHVRVGGRDVARHGAAVRRSVGFVFTDPDAQLVMPTPAEDIALSLRRLGVDQDRRRGRALEILGRYGLAHLADVSVHALSGGQKQLLAIAGVLATDPAVVVADEPTTLLDLQNTRRVADLLLGLRQQVVLVTHDLALAARCHRGLVIDEGRIRFDGTGAEAAAAYAHLVDPDVPR